MRTDGAQELQATGRSSRKQGHAPTLTQKGGDESADTSTNTNYLGKRDVSYAVKVVDC